MRQRAKIAQALVHEPAILVLDEPLSGIDPTGRMELMGLFRVLAREGRTVVVSSHILHEVERLADRIVLIAHGRILAAGTLTSIRELLAEYPLTVRITSERPRELASTLLREPSVSGVSVGSAASMEALTVKVRRPDVFFDRLPEIVLDLDVEVTRLEATDASAEAVFHYLIGEDATPEEGVESGREGAI
jgi:ABC-2 type transport system ATP-binding protein